MNSDAPRLSTFPEELLERILSHCVVSPLVQPSRPSWHRPGGSSELAPIRGRQALLLVSKTFLRICTPLFYHTVHITSATQLHRLLCDALRPSSFLATHIRRVVLSGIWAEGGELLRMCGTNLKMLDITLDVTQLPPAMSGVIRDLDAEDFCEALTELKSLNHIAIRKPTNVYLTHPKPRYILTELAKAMQTWDALEHADIAFRLSDDSGAISAALPNPPVLPARQGPITALTHSLSTRPKLHTLSTLLPSVWNETILRVSVNPSLERIILGDGNAAHGRGLFYSGRDFYAGPVSASLPTGPILEGSNSIAPTSLFMLGAKKHTRLNELVRAGTYISRGRAQTMGTQSPSSAVSPVSQASSISSQTQASASSASPHYMSHQGAPRCFPRSQSVMPSNEPKNTHLQGRTAKHSIRRAESTSCQPLSGPSVATMVARPSF